jgi:hypothetical protein
MVYLDEEMVDQDFEIAYPHLLLCGGLTLLLDDGSLVGAHLTSPSHDSKVLTSMADFLSYLPVGVKKVGMLLCCNVSIHCAQRGGVDQDLKTKANALGFQGPAYVFDTGRIKPKDGTFVLVSSNGSLVLPAIQYKRDEKMKYDTELRKVGRRPKVFKTGHRTASGSKLHTVPEALVRNSRHDV